MSEELESVEVVEAEILHEPFKIAEAVLYQDVDETLFVNYSLIEPDGNLGEVLSAEIPSHIAVMLPMLLQQAREGNF